MGLVLSPSQNPDIEVAAARASECAVCGDRALREVTEVKSDH